jgi:hypothetical protein
VTLAVTGNTNTGRVSRRQRVPEIQGHRLPLIGSRWDIRWLIGRRTNPTFCVFPVFSVAVMEKCCDACRDGEYNFRYVFSASEGAGVSVASIVVDRKSMDIRWLIGRRTKPTFLYFLYLAWRLWKSVVTLVVTGILFPVRFFGVIGCRSFKRHRLPLTGSRWDIGWLIGRRTKPTFCVFPVFSVAVMESVVTLSYREY